MPKSRNKYLKSGETYLDDLVDGQAVYGYPGGDYSGRQYYVNNITGSSGGDGSDWENAMDEVSTAITASAAYLATYPDSTNWYIRNQIFVQGTGTPYSEITALPSYCDMIGIGADARRNGAGVVRIGEDTGSGGGLTGTTAARGLSIHNIQFQAGVSNYPFQAADLFGVTLSNVTFASNGSPGGNPTAGFDIGRASGLVMKNCHWMNQSSKDGGPTTGFNVTSTHFHNCWIENCFITGVDAGIAIAAECVNGWGSQFKDCYIGWGGETCAIGVDDNATDGHIIYRDCSVFATDEYDLAHNGTGRIIPNE